MINTEKEIWIFLSHSNKDFEKVRKIRNYLEEHSCRPLMFYLMCLNNDDEISDLIKREIDCRDRFIICSSENSRSSKWVQAEVSYITSCQRTYDIIDLSIPDDEINRLLDAIIRRIRVCLIGSDSDKQFAWDVFAHIRKYDLRCMIEESIEEINKVGFVVFFASNLSLKSQKCLSLLAECIKQNVPILVLDIDKYADINSKILFKDKWDLIYTPRKYVSGIPDNQPLIIKSISTVEEPIETAIDEILNRAFPCWDIYTMAKNFLEGFYVDRDEDEANRLFKIAYKKADELDSDGYPGGTLFLARCQANGYGTPKDLQEALLNYHHYLRMCGGNEFLHAEIAKVQTELNESS